MFLWIYKLILVFKAYLQTFSYLCSCALGRRDYFLLFTFWAIEDTQLFKKIKNKKNWSPKFENTHQEQN